MPQAELFAGGYSQPDERDIYPGYWTAVTSGILYINWRQGTEEAPNYWQRLVLRTTPSSRRSSSRPTPPPTSTRRTRSTRRRRSTSPSTHSPSACTTGSRRSPCRRSSRASGRSTHREDRRSMTLTSSNRADVAAAPAIPAPPRRGIRTARLVGFKVLGAALVLLGAATAAFFAQASIPGDRATVILNMRAGQAHRAHARGARPDRRRVRPRQPAVRAVRRTTCRGSSRGDLGTSYQQFRPVIDIIADQLGATIVLTLAALVLAWVHHGRLGHPDRRPRPAGASASAPSPTPSPRACRTTGSASSCCSSSRSGCGWFPVIGGTGAIGLVLPALTLAIPLAGFMGQATRTEFERALDQPFVLSARTRGMGDTGIRLRPRAAARGAARRDPLGLGDRRDHLGRRRGRGRSSPAPESAACSSAP